MEITLLGHSCFRLRSDDLAIITDPFPDSIGLHMGNPSAIAITISHRHPNHAHEGGVAGDPKVLRGPGEYELSGIYITGIMTPRGENDPPDKRNTTYLFEMENIRLCHLGDINNSYPTPHSYFHRGSDGHPGAADPGGRRGPRSVQVGLNSRSSCLGGRWCHFLLVPPPADDLALA